MGGYGQDTACKKGAGGGAKEKEKKRRKKENDEGRLRDELDKLLICFRYTRRCWEAEKIFVTYLLAPATLNHFMQIADGACSEISPTLWLW